jgi:8-oxo-dGTP diphosphatase
VQACRREAREECGIELRRGRLACVDFRRPKPGNPGGIRFLFDCGSFEDSCLAAITVQAEEICEHRLAALPEALALLRRPIRRRVRAATSGRALVYLEQGHRVDRNMAHRLVMEPEQRIALPVRYLVDVRQPGPLGHRKMLRP